MPILQMRKLRYGMGRTQAGSNPRSFWGSFWLPPGLRLPGHAPFTLSPRPLSPPPPTPPAQARCSESQRVTLPFTSFLPVKGPFLP